MSRGGAFLVLGFLLLVFVSSSAYTVHETEQAIVTQFGRPVRGPLTEAGLYFRVPFIQQVLRFDKRILEWSGEPNEILTKDKKTILVDTTARWRIRDPLLFLQSVRDERVAQSRIDDILDAAAKNAIRENNLIEAVREQNRDFNADPDLDLEVTGASAADEVTVGRERLIHGIFEDSKKTVAALGIELIDFRVRRIDYAEKVRQEVYARMIAERNQIAEKYRSEGEGKRAEIEGQKEKEERRIESEGIREAETIRGRADAAASTIYADAYGADPDFYAFVKTLDTYRTAFVDGDTTLVLSTENKLLRLLKEP